MVFSPKPLLRCGFLFRRSIVVGEAMELHREVFAVEHGALGELGFALARRIQHLAAMYQIPPEKFVKDLQKRNGLIEIYDQLMNEKVVAFLQQNAKIEEVPAGSLSQPQTLPNPA